MPSRLSHSKICSTAAVLRYLQFVCLSCIVVLVIAKGRVGRSLQCQAHAKNGRNYPLRGPGNQFCRRYRQWHRR